jgi:DNA-binding NarL/FixJ family response regulator
MTHLDPGSGVRVRVLIADDNQSLRYAVGRMLATDPTMNVCGEAENGREALAKTVDLRPDVVLMDIAMPEMNGLEVTRAVRKLAPGVEVLVFTQHESPHAMQAALDAGARGYLAKTHAASLLEAIRTVARHKTYSSLPGMIGKATFA